MEKRKIRTPSARMLAAKEHECGLPLPKSLLPAQLTQLVQAQTTPASSRTPLESLQKAPFSRIAGDRSGRGRDSGED
ncbi:hypothetical protein B9Z55_028508 [Caenorhabditis nigoni]|uniref:Uncharacterized protein n=1 Tax=Caenorhabditis nigoni TaxID=1611254 RepID=A0A2G5SB48_9PELO|nr:hypothetical protein B9Z55_028508 [Caenorhabditis nigoni]